MKQLVVLGIGNRLMGDDGIGVRVVEALRCDNQSEKIRFSAGETDVFYCLDELACADLCIIIDGACSGEDLCPGEVLRSGREPCSVEVMDLKEVFAQRRSAQSFHDFDLFHAMRRENIMKEGILITIEICSVELSAELSPLMEERFDEIVREIKVIINSYLLDREKIIF